MNIYFKFYKITTLRHAGFFMAGTGWWPVCGPMCWLVPVFWSVAMPKVVSVSHALVCGLDDAEPKPGGVALVALNPVALADSGAVSQHQPAASASLRPCVLDCTGVGLSIW